MHYRIAIAALSSLLVLLSLVPDASAQRTAQAHLERRHEEVNQLLRQPAETDAARRTRSQRLTRILDELLDYEALSENALGEHWGEHTAEDRARFVTLLQQLVERNYENSMERILEFEVTYDGETRRGEETIVRTSARSRSQRRQPPVEIEYTLRRVDGAWRVVDVTTDGVSMVQNYRSQFNRIIGRDGWAELITRMERRLERSDG